jgi:adenosylcobinamide-phosphate synthase
MNAVFGLLIAWCWDALFGEPRNRFHPVAWLGRVLWPLGCRLRVLPPRAAFWGGVLAWWAVVLPLAALAAWVEWMLPSALWGAALVALLLKPSFAWRMLRDEVAAVEAALAQGLQPARDRLARLVSRDVSGFDEAELRETALETLAENLNDSLVAPLFWFAVAGLPGAVVYRAANTMDAMWGYRGVWEWAGKWAARADDLLSWVPARLTATLLWPWRTHRDSSALRRESRRTPSPNGGWPMAALALRLGVRLSKPDVYVLNAAGRAPQAADMQRALRWAGHAAWGAVALALLGRLAWAV